MHASDVATQQNGSRGRSRDGLDVVVIGAGQAGLAIGYYLARQGRRFVILEAADSVGAAWRTRWDSLVLFTLRRYDALDGLPFPGDPDGYPTRDEVIAYLEQYAATFELPIELNSTVRSLKSVAGKFVVELDERQVEADQVVVATGPFQVPNVPALAGRLASDVFQTHSTGYMRPSDVPNGTVVVVGGGNTGYQIAKELSATHQVHLALGTRQTPLPQRFLGRDLFWWLTKTGLIKKTVDSRIGRRAQHRDTLIGSTPRELRRRYGVELKPRVVDANGRTLSFADGSELAVDAVIWATGYRSDYSWIGPSVLGADGRVQHRRGVTDVHGLYLLGLSWQHTRGSALIGWVKDDAEFIAAQIDAEHQERASTRELGAMEDDRAAQATSATQGADMKHHSHDIPDESTHFPTDVDRLQEATGTQVVELADGAEFDLRIAAVVKRVSDASVRMLAYSGTVPGPTLRVREGSELVVNVHNEGDLDATVHWHGLRLDNRYDGTHETQAPIGVGESFSYRITFPDPGVYWYHPHIREDYGQELGLYGNIVVVPSDPDYWPPVHRELLLTLDDLLIEDGTIAPFSRSETTHAAMGRFGNVLLVGGETDLGLTARQGEVVRFYLTNTANTRVFNVAVPGAKIKLVGGDSGRYEREEFVESVILAPSERVVIDVLFERPGELTLEHRTPERTYALATIDVGSATAAPSLATEFSVLRDNAEWVSERERLAPYFDAPPDKTLALVAEMSVGASDEATSYVCPMHPEVVSDRAERCPKCGMKLIAAELVAQASEHGRHIGHHADHEHGHGSGGHSHGHKAHDAAASEKTDHSHHGAHHGHHERRATDGIEWEDDMVDVNRLTTPANMHWNLIDRETGAVNHAIDWQFRVGDRVKLRLVNEMDSDHPMHHPFHIHGAGRFVVLARDGAPEANLVWKDTVLVRTGETVDLLLDVTNPGRWMAHCHIAEHHESGMMFSFVVAAADGR